VRFFAKTAHIQMFADFCRDNMPQVRHVLPSYNPCSRTEYGFCLPMTSLKLAFPLLLLANFAHASCGSSYCMVNTNWDTQGLSNDGGLQADLRYSYAKADRFMAGSSKRATEVPGGGTNEEIENKRTINQLVNLNLDYAINRQWGVTLGLPFVMRDHTHTFDAASGAFEQQAKFSELGDIRLLGKFKLNLGNDAGAGFRFGFKLPTGATNKTMSPPDPNDPTTPYALERSSQPGTGSTDGILGAYYFQNAPGKDWGWFISGQVQSAISTKDNYRPGNEVAIDVGAHYEVAQNLNLLLQLNGQHRSRDTGANANPASGGYAVNLSPGLSYAVTPQTQVYGYLQLPIVQYLNTNPAEENSGQLAARWSATIGITQRF